MKKLFIPFILFFSLFSSHIIFAQDMVQAVSNEGLEKVVAYNVASFTDVRDKTLEDVLAKMPGMSITPFTYNGMTVVQVFVNGIDMLNGDYSSVKNMKPEDVESIEITENYVYEKVLRGIEYSNSVSINVILKDSAKSKWSGSIKGGLGATPLLHNLEAMAINLGQKAQTTVLVKSDNTGLDYSLASSVYGRSFSFLSVQPSLAPLSSQRTRFNDSNYGNVSSTIQLGKDLQMSMKLIYHSEKLTAYNYGETEYYLSDGDKILNVSGKDAIKKQKDFKAEISFLSNTSKNYFKNVTSFLLNSQYGYTDISGTYPSTQTVNIKPMTIENELAYVKPFGNSVFSINFNLYYDTKPQNLSVERSPFNLNQDVGIRAYTEELEAEYKFKLGRFSFAATAGVNSKLLDLDTKIDPSVEEVRVAAGVETLDNDSRFSYINADVSASATYIDDKFQVELATPLHYYRNFFNNFMTDESSHADRWHFEPSLSGKYQITDNLSVSASISALNNGLVASHLYYGLALTDFQSFSQGVISDQNDKSAVTNASITYRLPKQSFFVNATYYRMNMNQEIKYISKFTENFNISGYQPVADPLKSITDMASFNASKGIKSFKGKVGLNGSISSSRATIDRNDVRLPYTSQSYSLGADINGRILNWMNMIYSVSYSHSNLTMKSGSETLMASKTNGLTQSLEFIFVPWDIFNFSILGDHYMNQIAQDTYKNVVILDFKAEYKINDRWQLIGSITNLLNQNTYDYILISSATASSSYTSYSIRPRNFMLSAFFKF